MQHSVSVWVSLKLKCTKLVYAEWHCMSDSSNPTSGFRHFLIPSNASGAGEEAKPSEYPFGGSDIAESEYLGVESAGA